MKDEKEDGEGVEKVEVHGVEMRKIKRRSSRQGTVQEQKKED